MQNVLLLLKRKLVLAVLAAVAVGAGAYAFAATLNVTSGSLSAGSAAILSCDTDGVTVNYSSSFDPTSSRYEVSSLTLVGLSDTCDGKTLLVQFTNQSNATVGGELSLSIPTASGDPPAFTNANTSGAFTAANISAQDAANVNVAIV
jgi:hypothetical protein